MSKRTASWLAWTMCALSLALTSVGLVFHVLNLSHPNTHIYDYWIENTVLPISFSIIGAIIASRLPANSVGWLFCAAASVSAVTNFSAGYATYALLAQPNSLPAGEALAWLSYWVWFLGFGCIVLSLLLFPNGRLPSSGWRWLAWLTVLLTIVGALWVALSPGVIVTLGSIRNPLGIEGLPSGYWPIQTIMSVLLFVAAVSTLGLRLPRARGVERQQIKWPAYTAVVATVGNLLYDTAISEAMGLRWLEWAGYVVVIATLVGFPLSIGIAIVRYRLYEIDTLINRTLVYGALTVMLGLVYFGGVTATQAIFRTFTGQGNTLAIVASTLAIAALFNPLRRRIQGFIDRSFYRRTYDARKTLEAFGSKLRDETDLEKLCEDLAEVVDETMQPAHVSVILRSEVPSSTTTKEQGQQDQQTTTHEG